MPDSSRMVVPEFRASSGDAGARRPCRPRPSISTVSPRSAERVRRISTPAVREAVERGGAIGALRVLRDRGSARRQRGKQRVSMRNGFVAGKPDRALDAAGRPHRRSGD